MKISKLLESNRIKTCHICLDFNLATKIFRWIDIDIKVQADYMCNRHVIEAIEWEIKSLQETKEKIENETH